MFGFPRCSSASTVFVEMRLDSVDELIRKQRYNFKLRLENSHNGIIHAIYNSYSLKMCKLYDRLRINAQVLLG